MRFSSWVRKKALNSLRTKPVQALSSPLRVEHLEDRNLPSTLFVVPSGVAADATHFHDLQSAVNQASFDEAPPRGMLDTIQIEPNSTPGPAFVPVFRLTIQGDPNFPASSLPELFPLTLDDEQITLNNLNLSLVTLDNFADGENITHCLIGNLRELSGGLGSNFISANTISGFTDLAGGTLASGDQVVGNLMVGGPLNLGDESNVLIQGNTFSVDGINVYASQGEIVGNAIHARINHGDGIKGIFVGSASLPSNLSIVDNTIDTAGTGVGIATVINPSDKPISLMIAGNDLVQNLFGIQSTGDGAATGAFGTIDAGGGALGSPGQNDFHGFTGTGGHFAVQCNNRDTPTLEGISAENNIFSTSTPATVVYAEDGHIDVSGALDANHAFVATLYRDFLQRTAGSSELNGWVSVLTAPGGSQSEIASAIAHSLEAEKLLVNKLYVHFLGRQAGAGEQTNWANQLQLGATEEQVIAGLVSSPEFATHLHTLVPPSGSAAQDYVEALYTTLLGRAPSSSEVAGWVAALAGGASRDAIALAFATSAEYRDDQVAVFYSNLLHRAGSAAEIASWAATSFDLLTIEALFAGSSEFAGGG
jgi:hypothetical protein